MVAILQSHYLGALDDFTFIYTYSWSSNKARLEKYNNGLDLKANASDDFKQIHKIDSQFSLILLDFPCLQRFKY